MKSTVFTYIIKFASVFIIFSLVLIFVQCKNQNKETPKEQDKTENSQHSNPEGTKEPAEIIRDDNGNIIERHSKSYRKKDGSLRSSDDYYYKHDENGNVIEETKESFSPDGTLNYKNVNFYTYDDKNQKIEMRFFSYDGNNELQRKARNTYEYDDKEFCILEHSYGNDDKLFLKIIRNQNNKGELTSEEFIHFDPTGRKKEHKKYYYSDFGLERTEDMMDK